MDGEQIKRARERKGWTQEQLATAVGVGPRTVGNWERGSTVSRNRTGRLEKVLGDELAEVAGADPVRDLDEIALLSELLRRAAARDRGDR